jgi:hypothetical protein
MRGVPTRQGLTIATSLTAARERFLLNAKNTFGPRRLRRTVRPPQRSFYLDGAPQQKEGEAKAALTAW